MGKKVACLTLWAVLFTLSVSAHAQQPAKVPRIGFVSGSGDSNTPGPQIETFRQGLRDLGYIEGKNILIEYRYLSSGGPVEAARLVAELLQLKLDVFVVSARPAIRAAKQATKTIPIVMVTTQDPVKLGFVDSLARPGGNITGVTRLTRELSGKRLELLKEMIPAISRIGVICVETGVGSDFQNYEDAARALKIPLQAFLVQREKPNFEEVFRVAAKRRINAFILMSTAAINRYSKHIAELAIKNRMLTMFERSEEVAGGGLTSYSSNDADNYKRAAVYVDKILKGAKPADLPVEQPMKFEFVINLKTAKQIGLTIPPNVLVRADKVIR